MSFFSRSKFYLVLSLLVISSACLALLTIPRLGTRAADSSLKLSMKPGAVHTTSAVTCGVWNIVSSPSPGVGNASLSGVSAINTNDVWAFGSYVWTVINQVQYYQTLIEHWDGTSWSVVPSPNVGSGNNFLGGAAAISAKNVWAVGSYYPQNQGPAQTLIEHWDGTSWSVVPSPNVGLSDNALRTVTRIPGTNQLWAVGFYTTLRQGNDKALIERWDGTSWSVVPTPKTGTALSYLDGVTAIDASNAWAAGGQGGSNSQTLIEHWDGTSWSIVPSLNSDDNDALTSVTRIPGTDQIWSTGYASHRGGYDKTQTEHWNGASWSIVASPNVGSYNNVLGATVAISARNVWAVGNYDENNGNTQALIEHWDGMSWSVVTSPPSGSSGNLLGSITRIPGTTQLWAVGDTFNGPAQTLIEFYC
jgi:hypothetical protein